MLVILHSNLVNPAFLVQLFARLLHYIGARLFNGLVEEPARVSPQWGRLLFEWIHKKLVGWAEPQGLRVAVECYLTRLSQVYSSTLRIKVSSPCRLIPITLEKMKAKLLARGSQKAKWKPTIKFVGGRHFPQL